MRRAIDWSPLEIGSDPIPGDPDLVRAGGEQYLSVADAIKGAASTLRSMELDEDESEATAALITNAGDVADDIERAEARYRETGLALTAYAPRLASAQDESLSALEIARQAQQDAAAAETSRWQLMTLSNSDDDPAAAAEHREQTQQAEAQGDAAADQLARARRLLQSAIDDRDSAASDAANRIQSIVEGDDLNDSWWDNWGADLLAAITDIAGWISTIAGVLALCVSWIPVVGQVLAGALLIVAGVAAVVNAIGNVVLASTGDRSWGEALISIAGAALSVVGLGAVARSLGKVATVARINKAASAQPLGPGEVVNLVPLTNANRFTTAQLREAEGLWRAPVNAIDSSSPLYRLYGGGSGQVGGSFGSIDPTSLRFPHNSLGLPANNTMESMATFRIDDLSQMVNQRHALPYQGTLGGAPEYIFPGANGVSVVSDIPFVVP